MNIALHQIYSAEDTTQISVLLLLKTRAKRLETSSKEQSTKEASNNATSISTTDSTTGSSNNDATIKVTSTMALKTTDIEKKTNTLAPITHTYNTRQLVYYY